MKLVHIATVFMTIEMATAAVMRVAEYNTTSAALTATATKAPDHFHLKTQVKPTDSSKKAFDGLYVYPYYTAPDTYDAALTPYKSRAPTSHANYGPVGGVSGPPYFDVAFNITSQTTNMSFHLWPRNYINYAAKWEPVGIQPGLDGPSSGTAFFPQNGTLQWTDEAGFFRPASFHGWIVCQWRDPNEDIPSKPGLQLFFRFNSPDGVIPSTCADVDLVLQSTSV